MYRNRFAKLHVIVVVRYKDNPKKPYQQVRTRSITYSFETTEKLNKILNFIKKEEIDSELKRQSK